MPIVYDGLLERLKERGVKHKLRKGGISPSILDKIEKGTGGLDARTIGKLCSLLECQPGDLMRYVEEE